MAAPCKCTHSDPSLPTSIRKTRHGNKLQRLVSHSIVRFDGKLPAAFHELWRASGILCKESFDNEKNPRMIHAISHLTSNARALESEFCRRCSLLHTFQLSGISQRQLQEDSSTLLR